MQFGDPGGFVGLRALRQGGQETGEVHPGCVPQEDGAGRVVGVDEGAEEGVEVVGGGGEVEPCWVQGVGDVGVELGHARDGLRVGDEGRAEDADGGRRHGYFDGVVDV